MPSYEELGFGGGAALTGDRARTIFGHVMGLVAVTMGFAALGAYLGRNMVGGTGILFLLVAFVLIFGLNRAAARGREQLAVAMLFGLGLLMGLGIAPIIGYYANANPGVVYQAAGATALFTLSLGAFGYTTRRDLSRIWKYSMIAFGIVFLFGLITLFVAIPSGNIIYAVLMLLVFGAFVTIDFNRLAHTGTYQMAAPIAAAIFLDVLNIFLLFLQLFGGGSSSRR
jgi:modulator of FtsH protease